MGTSFIIILPFAFLSGIVTILSPCILPVLPIVLSGSVGGKSRPYGVITGFILSFSVFTLALSSLVQALNISPDVLRIVAVVLIVLFGLIMIVPRLRLGFESIVSRFAGKGQMRKQSSGFTGGLLVGLGLGLVWTPCVGPIMASVISLAFTQSVDGGAVFIVLSYSIGTAIPMLGVMLGGRRLLEHVPSLSRNTAKIQRLFGILMVLVGVSIGFGWDRQFQGAVLRVFPNYGAGLTVLEDVEPVRRALEERAGADPPVMMMESVQVNFDDPPKSGRLGNYGPAPELVTQGEWFNVEGLGLDLESESLSMTALRGKVVLLDFWTYSCVNCVRTIPHLRSWYDAYHDQGFVIIGVHTPEFVFEQKPENVQKAMRDLGVTWPVVLDNEYAQWRAYSNRYWPAHYFIDATGHIRYFHFGEGKYKESEEVIRALLSEAGESVNSRADAKLEAKYESRTHETYLGYARTSGFVSEVSLVRDQPVQYRPTRTPENGEWNLTGTWKFNREYVVAEDNGELELGFHAKNVFLVVEPEGDGRIEVLLDGKTVADTEDVRRGILRPDESRLYQLVALRKPGKHVLNLKVYGNLRLFAFTFG